MCATIPRAYQQCDWWVKMSDPKAIARLSSCLPTTKSTVNGSKDTAWSEE